METATKTIQEDKKQKAMEGILFLAERYMDVIRWDVLATEDDKKKIKETIEEAKYYLL